MPPARPRAVADDARSETSSVIATAKERNGPSNGVTKSKKINQHTGRDTSSALKTAAINGAIAAASAPVAASGATAAEPNPPAPEFPHTDWPSFSLDVLLRYRSAYRLSTPAVYASPMAELIYNTSTLASRAPSQVLARRKARDLKLYRAKIASHSSHGISKSRSSKMKDAQKTSREQSRDGRRKQAKQDPEKDSSTQDDSAIAPSIEPPSPTADSQSISNASHIHTNSSSEQTIPSTAKTTVDPSDSNTNPDNDMDLDHEQETEPLYTIPSTLNPDNPEATVIGLQSSQSLATTIRKHFNAQHLNEAETIARFTYVVRQQGCAVHSRGLPLAQRLGLSSAMPARVGDHINGVLGTAAQSTAVAAPSATNIAAAAKGQALLTGASSHLGGGHVGVEGSAGDGRGWIMGSMGREVRMMDGAGGGAGTFRLRFRP